MLYREASSDRPFRSSENTHVLPDARARRPWTVVVCAHKDVDLVTCKLASKPSDLWFANERTTLHLRARHNKNKYLPRSSSSPTVNRPPAGHGLQPTYVYDIALEVTSDSEAVLESVRVNSRDGDLLCDWLRISLLGLSYIKLQRKAPWDAHRLR